MEKKDLFIKIMIWIAVVVFLVVEVIGLCWGHVIEGSLFAEVMKWLVWGVALAGLVCGTVWALVATIVSRKKDKGK